MNVKTPIAYAQEACETLMRLYPAEELPPKGHFHYHQGVFLSGMCKTAALIFSSSSALTLRLMDIVQVQFAHRHILHFSLISPVASSSRNFLFSHPCSPSITR